MAGAEPVAGEEEAAVAQRARFLAFVRGVGAAGGVPARLRLRGGGAAPPRAAAGRLLALDAALSECLLVELETPLGVLPAARVRLDTRGEVLWLELGPTPPGAADPLARPLADFAPQPPRSP